ncbi:myosin regulatory light chain 1 [Rhypophila decipiens]
MSMPSAYKPSPLGYGSPRSSPFRRPESPVTSSPFRQTTLPASPSRPLPASGRVSTSRFVTSPTAASTPDNRTPRGNSAAQPEIDTMPLPQPAALRSPVAIKSMSAGGGNAVSQLPVSQVRTLREGFQILDRDSDGVVNRDDVADMLTQLGLPANPSDVSQFFPPSAPQTMTLAVFLNSLSASLAALSPSSELLSAFSAFDDDDSGQIDLAELRDALLHTAPEPGERALTAQEVDKVMNGFTGRRAFSKSNHLGQQKRGEVFKYQDFVASVLGGSGRDDKGSENEGDA